MYFVNNCLIYFEKSTLETTFSKDLNCLCENDKQSFPSSLEVSCKLSKQKRTLTHTHTRSGKSEN